MTYRIRITDLAKNQIDDFITYVEQVRQEPINAGRLLEAIYDGIDSLRSMPRRCAEAPESQLVDPTVRMLIVKRTLIVLFTINEADRTVVIQGFRHGRQLPRQLPLDS